MRHASSIILLLIAIAAMHGLTGCATVRTMPNMGSYGSPKLYSGTRLD